jgi:hypothetical protein
MSFENWEEVRTAVRSERTLTAVFNHSSVSSTDGQLFSHWFGITTDVPPGGSTPAASPGEAYVSHPNTISFADTTDPKYLLRATCGPAVFSGNSGYSSSILIDRLIAVSGLALGTSGVKTINSVALPRYTDGFGVWALIEIESVGPNPGTNHQWRLASYTNHLGVAGRVGPSRTFTLSDNRFVFAMPLASGDLGIRSVEQFEVIAAAATTVNANLVLVKPLIAQHSWWNGYEEHDHFVEQPVFARVYNGASLARLVTSGAGVNADNGSNGMRGSITVVY